ncbi:MAG: hypothetical protein FWB90_04960 [Fibromonadales bacterium]|nr:hypothetical protein [Fibromonadales bacterium]
MKRKLFSAAIIATSLLFAVGFFACSDDKESDKGVSCKKFEEIVGQCYDQYESQYDACELLPQSLADVCEDSVDQLMDTCIMPQVCKDMSDSECEEHYDSKCEF